MREYVTKKTETKVVGRIYCNRCGREIAVRNGTAAEEVLHVEHQWGYDSAKDGERHCFDLCEKCYDELLKTFQIPAEKKQV